MSEYNGLPVAGYQPQSAKNISVVNDNKVLEERALRQIDAMEAANKYSVSINNDSIYDARMLALARTGIQQSFMWLNRAVFQPARVALPEDEQE